jgi:MFS family permease
MERIVNLIKGAYGGLSPSIWLLALTQLINRCGTMVVFFLALYLRMDLNFNLGDVGILMGVFGAGSLLGVFIGGKLVDRIGYYPVLLTSLFAGGAMFFVTYEVKDFLWLCISLFVLNALGEAFRPANIVATYFYSTPETYTRAISLNRLAINLGFSIAPIVGSWLAESSYRGVFWMDGFTCIGAGLLVLFFLQNKFDPEKRKNAVATSNDSPWKDKAYLFFIPLIVLYSAAFFQIFSTMSLYFVEIELLSKTQIGWLMALNGLIVAGVEMVIIYKFQNKWTMYNFVATGAILLLLSYLMITLLHGYGWLVVFFIVISLSEILAMPFMNTYMNSRSNEHNKGQYASLYVMAWSVAQIGTPILSTRIVGNFGYNTLWIILAVFSLLVAIGFKRLEKIS